MSNEIIIKNKRTIKDYLPVWLKNLNSMFYYFVFLVLLGVIFFATSLFINYFTTPFTGDYTSQQFAFYTNGYDDWWHFFKTGEFVLYDTNTFLGADNIGSNSFYYLFDPFFLPILLVPRQLIPQGMAVLTIFKIAASGMTFFLYLKYMGASRRASKITGIAYAFSGWMTWYLWFNHFTEVAIVFPLILLGVEKVLKEKKPWVLAASICLMGFVNYFFCICFVMCAFLYAMFRYFQRIKLNNWKDNLIILGFGFLGFLVGLMLPMMVVFPSAMHALTSPRASGSNYFDYLKEAFKEHNLKRIYELLTSWTAISNTDQNKARSLYPFIDFIFPVTSCRGTPLTVMGNETYDNVAGSYYCFLPMTLLLVPALADSLKKKHFSVIVPFVFFIFALFTPMFYYLFHGFTQAYSRWTLFITTSILTYTGLYLDKLDDKEPNTFIFGWLTEAILVVGAAVSADYIVKNYGETFTSRVPIWLVTVIELAYITVLTFVLIIVKFKKKVHFYKFFTGFIVVEIALMGAFVIQGHGVEDYYYTNKGLVKNNVLRTLVAKTTKKDSSYYRSYSSLASSSASNDEMRNGYNGANFFHSIYNYNTADICNWSAITNGTAPGSWSGDYLQKRANLDVLLGIKYYYVEDDYYQYQKRGEVTSKDFRYNVPFNYVDVTDEYPNSEFRVYKNMDYVDFALTYDKAFITIGDPSREEKYEGVFDGGYRDVLAVEDLYLKGVIINAYRTPNIENILLEHPDISYENAKVESASKCYRQIPLQRYSDNFYSSSMLTFYDILSGTNSKGESVNSLGLTAREYIELLNRDNDTFKKMGYTVGEDNRRWVGVLEIKDTYMDSIYDPNGMSFYVRASYYRGSEVDIYFVDTNDEIVTYDNHNDGFHSSYRSGKDIRGFYITPTYNADGSINKPAPKIKKIIFAYRGNKPITSSPAIYYESYTDYALKYEAMKEYQVTDVISNKANTYKFKTNFDKERIVVTRLAYEDGFKLVYKDANGQKQTRQVFNGQGGFASFISDVGECSYTLTFSTPYLEIASLISGMGIIAYFSSLCAYLYIDIRKLKKESREEILRIK